ncbi:hypothetical protein RRG08_001649 [Elysia crispata]|uniref:Uncharacterized protein n=1 Tax=Elysia crispata TaxID=231223 RepID=A0AAE1AJU6_9GAST|nr:hypothetical protein RRG08_001649 [Elysia crispata]
MVNLLWQGLSLSRLTVARQYQTYGQLAVARLVSIPPDGLSLSRLTVARQYQTYGQLAVARLVSIPPDGSLTIPDLWSTCCGKACLYPA